MSAGTEPASVLWAALLCAAMAVLAAQGRDDTRGRAGRLFPAAGSGPGPDGGPDAVSGPGDSESGERQLTPTATGDGGRLDRLREAVIRGWAAAEGRWLRYDQGDKRTGRLRSWLIGRLGRDSGWAVGRPGTEPAGRLPGRPPVTRVGPEALGLPVGAVLALLTASVLPLLAGAAAVPLVGRALRRRAGRAAAERGAEAVSALCGTVAGDLRAGQPPHVALADAIESAGWPGSADLARAARLLLSAARFGGDVPHALREASSVGAGTQGLAAVAACWQVAVDGGAGLAAALDRVAAALRADADQRDDLRAQLAGPRSTAVLLALLPLFGVVLGAGLGADPSTVLLHTPAGLLCLVAGGCLEWSGLAWTARIIRSAEGGSAARRAPKASPAGPPERGRL